MTSTILSSRSLWYLARGTGIVSISLLTAIVALGVGSRQGAGAPRVPRFALTLLHRNLALLAVVFLVVHISTSVLDPFAGIGWSDAVIPLRASYRPIWLGLGALAFDLLLALAISSLVRGRIGLRSWRAIHWLAYACWPVALVHGLGTGSDVRSPWLLGLTAGCVATVALAATVRLATSSGIDRRSRLALGSAIVLAPLMLASWLESGPLHQGWAGHAGTPAPLLRRVPVTTATGAAAVPRARHATRIGA